MPIFKKRRRQKTNRSKPHACGCQQIPADDPFESVLRSPNNVVPTCRFGLNDETQSSAFVQRINCKAPSRSFLGNPVGITSGEYQYVLFFGSSWYIDNDLKRRKTKNK